MPSWFEGGFWKRACSHAWRRARLRLKIPIGFDIVLLVVSPISVAAVKLWRGGYSAMVDQLWTYAMPMIVWVILYSLAFLYYSIKAPPSLSATPCSGAKMHGNGSRTCWAIHLYALRSMARWCD